MDCKESKKLYQDDYILFQLKQLNRFTRSIPVAKVVCSLIKVQQEVNLLPK